MRFFCVLALCLIAGCAKSEVGLKVAATPVPQAELLEFAKEALKEKGVNLIVITMEDYNIPNRALADKEVDANFFQHLPFLEEQIAQFHYPIESFAAIEIEPMGIYSKKINSLSALKAGNLVAIPNDPTNEGRALLLMQSQGLIQLSGQNLFAPTIADIVENPKSLRFIEVDAAMAPRSLDDAVLAVINTNYALQAGFFPQKDALAIESPKSPYANILAIRIGDEGREDLQALKAVMTSEAMKKFILEKYKGAILPVDASPPQSLGAGYISRPFPIGRAILF